MPGRSGYDGTCSAPIPEMTALGVKTVPSASVTFQRLASSSYSSASTMLLKRMCSRTRYLSVVFSMYERISGCGANIRDQPGLSSKENEYMWDGTSQAQPG